MRRARGLLGPLVACLAVWLVLRDRLDAVEVRGPSMLPTLRPGDRLLVARLARSPRPGEVVLAPDPRDPSRELIKRVSRSDSDGVALHGDNSAASTDARAFGAVPAGAIRWRAVVRYWPPDRIGPIKAR